MGRTQHRRDGTEIGRMMMLKAKSVEDQDFQRGLSVDEPEGELVPHAPLLDQAQLAALVDRRVAQAALNAINAQLTALEPPDEWQGVQTVMMQNIPNKITQPMLLAEFKEAGFADLFDFMYLPKDQKTGANKGYAFVNLIESSHAWAFKLAYEGRRIGHFNSNKVVAVVPAALQGYEANYAHYSTTRVSAADPETRPLFLRQPQGRAPQQQAARGGGLRASGAPAGPRQSSMVDQAKLQQQVQISLSSSLGIWEQREVVQAIQPAGVEQLMGSACTYHPAGSLPCSAFSGRPAAAAADNSARVPRFCHNCGHGIQPDFKFCVSCGCSLQMGW